MSDTQFAAQTAKLNTSDAASVKVILDAINASALNAADKDLAHTALDARVAVIKASKR